MSDVELMNRFRFHPAATPERTKQHEMVRSLCGGLAGNLDGILPPGHERDQALDRLEEVMFWANAAVARQPGAPF